MKKLSTVLAIFTASMFSIFFLSATDFAEGPMNLPEQAKADAKMHNKEVIKHW